MVTSFTVTSLTEINVPSLSQTAPPVNIDDLKFHFRALTLLVV